MWDATRPQPSSVPGAQLSHTRGGPSQPATEVPPLVPPPFRPFRAREAGVPVLSDRFRPIWSLSSRRYGVMRHKSGAATMDQTDIRGLVTTVHRSVMEAASL
jgi:hypothetical protein